MGKKDLKVILLIFFVALFLRIGFILTLDNSIDVWGDWWDELGWKIVSGQGYWVNNPYYPNGPVFYSWRPPFFPLFLAIVYTFFGHSFLAAKIALAFVGSFSCVLVFLLALKNFQDYKISIFSGLVYVFYPPGIFWTGYLAPVTLEIFFSLLFIYLVYTGGKEKNLILFLSSGIVLGLGILTRSLFLIFLPVVFMWLLVFRGINFSFKATLLIFLMSMLTISPWVIRNFKIHKKIVMTSTEGGIVCYIANNEKSLYQPSGYWDPTGNINEPIIKKAIGMSEVEANSFFYKATLDFIKKNPSIYAKLVKDRFFRFWKLTPHTFSGPGESYKSYHTKIALITNLPIFIFAAFGLFFSLKRWKDFIIFYLTIICWSLPIILFFKTVIRYREPLMPFIIIIACMGLKGIYSLVQKK